MSPSKIIILTVSFLAFVNTASAEVQGLPEELSGATEQIMADALEAVGEYYGCDLSEIKNPKLKIIESELQDEEYAEYPGEFSSFVLETKLTLPKNSCQAKTGKVTCSVWYDLYDSLAYEVDDAKVECN